MKTALTITLLLSGVAAIAIPVSAGHPLAEFEGRWNGSSHQSSSYVPSSHVQGENVRYYSADEYYSQRAPQLRGFSNAGHGSYGHKAKKSRFGYGNIYDYESGHCGHDCAPAPVQTYSRPTYHYRPAPQQTYRQITQYKCWDGEIVDTTDGCKPQYITTTIPQFRCWDGEIVTDENACKRQTITRQVASTGYSSSHSSSLTTIPTNCPSGTTAQSDGTCLESSYSSPSYGSSSSYSSSSSSFGGTVPTNCPSGTIAQSDGTCLESSSSNYSNPYTGSSVEIFSGDVRTTNSPTYGYASDGSYGAVDYLPIRK